VISICSKLAEEGSLSASVPVPKRMDCIDFCVVIGEPVGELVAWQSTQVPLAGELGKYGGRVALDMLRESEHAAGLCERRAAKLAGPLVDVLEDEEMELLKVPGYT
jgi:hypothetical protein